MTPCPSTSGWAASRGLTLLELLVVVSILAVLATVAVQTTTDIGNQTRYDTTQTSLGSFRDAVLGPGGQVSPDGTPMVTGFIADMGRPPRSRSIPRVNDTPVLGLTELHSETVPSGLVGFALHQASSNNYSSTLITTVSLPALLHDPNIRVPAGWRGPYLRKPSSELTYVDGWGKLLVSRPFDLGSSSSDIQLWPTMLLAFRTNTSTQPFSLEENPLYTAVVDANRDVTGLFAVTGFEGAQAGTDAYSGRFYSAITTNEFRVPITVTVNCASTNSPLASTNFVTLMMYGPNPEVATDGRPLRVWAQQANYTTYNVTFTFDNANAPTVGTRVFRAVLRLSSTSFVYSRTVYFPIRPGIQNINIPLP